MVEVSAEKQIDGIIEKYGGWKAANIAQLRQIIKAADPDSVEEVKWKMKSRPEGLPVWSHNGILCLLETFKDNQKLVFVKGAKMSALSYVFNARLNSSTDRAIEFKEGDIINEVLIQKLVHVGVQLNVNKLYDGN